MKHLILLNGTMGVGKTSVCQCLKQKLPHCVFLDGDWCWDMHPFTVDEETKALVLDNITSVLNRDLTCKTFDYILFCWVIHEESILQDLLRRLNTHACRVRTYSLLADADSIQKRIQKDIDAGLRTPDVIGRSLSRLTNYNKMDTIKVDTSNRTIEETAQWLYEDILYN